MQTVLEAFKLKPFDLQLLFTTWTDGPVFTGDPKKDMPVDEWLDTIKAGCEERKVPEECWHKVAQHFMGPKAKARLDELKAVIVKVHGGKYHWTWKKFKVAMESMGWSIDESQKETINISRTGSWWTLKKRKETKEPEADEEDTQSSLKRPPSIPFLAKKSDGISSLTVRKPSRSNTSDHYDSHKEKATSSRRPAPPLKSTSDITVSTAEVIPRPPVPVRSQTVDSVGHATTTQAPAWLLNACSALELITSEHPKAMSIISAILITAGSIPAIPAISAGAGGAILASGTAHAIGVIAVGVGQALSLSVKNQSQNNHDSTRIQEVPASEH